MKNQLLVLEDLGISKSDFENLAIKAGLSFEFVYQQEDVIKNEAISGIITMKATVNVDKNLLIKYPNLKFIAVAFTGYDCINVEHCRQNNIAVFNVPNYATNAVAELTIGLAISLIREISMAEKVIHIGSWNSQLSGSELYGKTVGILGTGTIGLRTAKLFQAFGSKIIGWSRTQNEEFKKISGEYILDLKQFIANADILSIHLPLTTETKNLLSFEELSVMKTTAYLINTARGPIINEKALIKILKDKKIAGAAIDVFDQEPLNSDNELLQLENVILTPHIAYKTIEAQEKRALITINNIADFLKDKRTNRVD